MDWKQLKPKLGNPNLSSTSIIVEDLNRHKYTGNIDQHLKQIAACVADKKGVILRFGNTIFFGVVVEPHVFSVHIYTVDTPRDLAGAINAAIDTAMYSGIKRLCASTKEENIIKMLIRMGYPLEVTKHEDTFSWSLEIKSAI